MNARSFVQESGKASSGAFPRSPQARLLGSSYTTGLRGRCCSQNVGATGHRGENRVQDVLLKAGVACSGSLDLQLELAFGTTREKITTIVKMSTTTKIRSPPLRRFMEPESRNQEIKIPYYAARFPSSRKLGHLVEMSMPCLSLFCGLQALGSRELLMYVCTIGPGVQIVFGGLLEVTASCVALLMSSGFLVGRKNMSEPNIG
jgi:hypothetical protein